jgi:threonine/homoserine/homoserine lactone efflux protein
MSPRGVGARHAQRRIDDQKVGAVSLPQALAAYFLAAGLLTITPGLDTAMILRTAAAEGPRRAAQAGLGIAAGCLLWGAAAALGVGALLEVSRTAYTVMKIAGAAYLVWLAVGLIARPRSKLSGPADSGRTATGGWFARGLMTNLLNPKVGVFYVSFLPQFVPAGMAPAPFMMLLAAIHVALGLVWCAVLIGATAPIRRWLQHPAVVQWLDRITGGVFLAFGLRLAFDRR